MRKTSVQTKMNSSANKVDPGMASAEKNRGEIEDGQDGDEGHRISSKFKVESNLVYFVYLVRLVCLVWTKQGEEDGKTGGQTVDRNTGSSSNKRLVDLFVGSKFKK